MDINRLFNNFLGSDAGTTITNTATQAGSAVKSATSNIPGGLAGGAVAGGIMALVLGTKKGRKYGKKAIKYGGVAALGGLAHKAYSDYSTRQPEFTPAAPIAAQQTSSNTSNINAQKQITNPQAQDIRLNLIQAMISAAKADGHIDTVENQNIMGQIDEMNLNETEKAFIFDMLCSKSDPIAIANLAQNDEQAVQLYLASLLAIDIDTPEEQRYLERLADALRLPEQLRLELNAQVNGLS